MHAVDSDHFVSIKQAHKRQERVVVYYLHKAIIISRDTICLFSVIYCHHCGMNRCRACLHVSLRAHAAEMSRYWYATDIICTNFNGLQTCTRYARPICQYIETWFYHKILTCLWYMREYKDYFLIRVYIITAFNLAVSLYVYLCIVYIHTLTNNFILQ